MQYSSCTFCIIILHSAYHSSEPKHPQDAASDDGEAAAAQSQAEEIAGAQAKDRGGEPHLCMFHATIVCIIIYV